MDGIYKKLVSNYKTVVEMLDNNDEVSEQIRVSQREHFKNLEKLTADELLKLNCYKNLATSLYERDLEKAWRNKF